MVMVLAIHCAFLVLILAQSGNDASTIKASAFTVMSLNAAANVQTKPPPPVLPSRMAGQFQPQLLFSLSDIFEVDAVDGISGDCSPLGNVSNSLQSNPVALAAIRAAPPETRSIANAVVLWNAGWSPAASTPEAPLGAVREVVINDLQSVDDGCLDEQVVGPRLVPIPDGDGTLFLVIGSGLWTWRDLLLEPMFTNPLAIDAATRTPSE